LYAFPWRKGAVLRMGIWGLQMVIWGFRGGEGMWLSVRAVCTGCGVYDCSQQEFVRVGYEIEEGVEISFVLPFIEPVEVGAFFGAGLIFFFLFDE